MVAARLGGGEFVLVLSEVKNVGAILAVLEKVRAAIVKPMRIGAQEIVVTPSIGVSLFPADGEDPQSLLRAAATALHVAKSAMPRRVSRSMRCSSTISIATAAAPRSFPRRLR